MFIKPLAKLIGTDQDNGTGPVNSLQSGYGVQSRNFVYRYLDIGQCSEYFAYWAMQKGGTRFEAGELGYDQIRTEEFWCKLPICGIFPGKGRRKFLADQFGAFPGKIMGREDHWEKFIKRAWLTVVSNMDNKE